MARNKIVYYGETLMDLTADTVTPETLKKGVTAHDKSGEKITGTCEHDVNSQDATVAVAEILEGKTAYARGTKLTGTMPNNGKITGKISSKGESYTVPMGFHDGSGEVSIDADEQAKITPSNIKAGVNILGVEGAYGGEAVKAQSDKEPVVPKTTSQTILPDEGYDYLSQVVVAAIPFAEESNSAGGTTVTIG